MGVAVKQVIVTIEMLSTEQGGRRTPISGPFYHCPVFFQGIPELSSHGYDCRMLVSMLEGPILSGDTIGEVGLLFLSEAEVVPHMRPGVGFTLWEGKTIGSGTVLRVEDHTGSS